MNRRVVVQTAPKKLEIVEEAIPVLGAEDVLVKNVAIGLCHSDVPQFLGMRGMGVDRYGRRTMVSPLQYPMYIGHEPVGVVVETGSAVRSLKPGDQVGGSMGGFADYTVVDQKRCIPVPPEVSPLKYCLPEPLTCIENMLQIANPEAGDYVAVIGCGMMGLMTIAGLSHSMAAEIIAVDINDERLAMAKKYGATALINPSKQDLDAITYGLTNGRGVDVAVEITGSLKGLKSASIMVRYADMYDYTGRGKILVPSLYGKEEPWDPEVGYNLMFRSPVLHVAHPWYCVDYRRTAMAGVDAYRKGLLPLRDMITHEFAFEDVQKGFELMISGDMSYLKGIVVI